MTTKRIVSALFVGSLIAACSSAEDPPARPADPAPDEAGAVDESTGPVSVVGDLVDAALADAKAGSQTLRFDGASSLRLHFDELGLAPTARLELESSEGGKATLTAANNGNHVWAPTLDGDTVVVRLLDDGSGPPGSYSVNRVARGFPEGANAWGPPTDPGAVSTVCGSDNRRRAACFSDPFKFPGVAQAAKSVGRITVVKKNLKSGLWQTISCTGFLVSADDLFLTNNHCFNADPNEFDFASFEVWFNHQYSFCSGTAEPNRSIFTAADVVRSSAALDYALVRLAPSVDGKASDVNGFLALDPFTTPVANATEIYIPQHPLGRHKTLAYFDGDLDGDLGGDVDDVQCKVKATGLNEPGDAPGSNVGYTCDTDGGSSGSPVLLPGTNKVIALHHKGGCNANGPYNLGVNIRDIYAEIASHLGGGGGGGGTSAPKGSCVGWCDKETAPEGCRCDDKCGAIGDCCADKAAVCGVAPDSCEGRCGSKTVTGCWCGGDCEEHKDCCNDKSIFCPVQPSATL